MYLVESLPGTEIGVHLHSTPENWKEKLEAAVRAGCKRFDGALKGIDLKDIVIGLEEGDSPKSIKKVLAPRLQNYGITGSAQPLAPTSGSPESSGNSDTYSGETPNTGVLDSFWGVLLISVSLLGGGVVLYFSLRKKDKKSAKMKSSL